MRNLETLNLMSNKIEEIPNEISGCIRLKTLQLDCNRLSCINQNIMQLQFLQDLSVSRNRLQCIPFGMLCSFNLLFIGCFCINVPSELKVMLLISFSIQKGRVFIEGALF